MNQLKNQISQKIEILGWVAVIAAAVSMFATPALSADLPAQGSASFVSCLQSEGNECRLIAPTVGISIGVAEGDAQIAYYVPAPQGLRVDHVDSVGRDIEAQVLGGRMSDDDAAYVFAELLSSHDLQYKLPENPEVLKRAVGFAADAPLSPQDQVDILASHVQMNLGVSAVTADYLVMKLGLQIIEPTDAPRP